MKKVFIYIFAACTLGLASCSDYLDVSPSDKQTAAQLFGTKSGFYAAQNGVYDALASDELYGKQMTWEAIEIMSQGYNTQKASTYYKDLAANSYTQITVSEKLSSIWQKAYETILAANLLIDQVDKQNGILSKDEADMMKGEMLATRAYLHLDMMRLFGPSPYYGVDAAAIPYNGSSNVTTLPLLTIKEVGEKIISDLEEAEKLLEKDPIIENGPMMSEAEDGSSVQMRYRQYRFNIYAVKALKARTYIWVGDNANARKEALALINDPIVQKTFPVVDPNQLLANPTNPDRVFSSEVFMGIYDKDRDNVFNNYFSSAAPTSQFLHPRDNFIVDDYGLFGNMIIGLETNDYRFQSQWEAVSGTGIKGHSFCKYKKIAQPDENDENSEYYYAKMIPLLKMQEMYYIVMETCDDDAEKVVWYNKARERRGLYSTDMYGVTDMFSMYWGYGYGNIFVSNEYRREFWGEGQWFFFAKRISMMDDGNVGMGYYNDNGVYDAMVSFDVKPALPSGEMK